MVTEKKSSSARIILTFISLALVYSSSYFQRTAVPGQIFNELQAEGLNGTEIGWISASFIYVYSLFQLFVGILVDKYCGSRVSLIGGLVLLTGVILFPLSHSLPMLYISRAIAGIGASCMYLSLVKEIDRLFDRKNYAMMLGVAYFFGYGGGLIGTLPFSRLCEIFPWRQVLLVVAGISVLFYIFFACCFFKSDLPKISREKLSLLPLLKIISNPYSWMMLFISSVNFCTYFVIQTVFGKKFLQDFAGMSGTASAGIIFALTLVCMFTILGTGIIVRYTGNRRKPWLFGATALILTNTLTMTAAIYFRWPGWVFAINYILFAVSAGVPSIFGMVMQELNSRSVMTQSTAVNNMGGYLAVALTAPLIGFLLEKISGNLPGNNTYTQEAYFTLFAIVSAITFLSFIMAFFIPETRGHYIKKSR